MRIGFINFTPLIYDVETPYIEPLGGSESAMCYLVAHLSDLKHKVYLFRKLDGEFTRKGVMHLPVDKIFDTDLDVLVIQNTPSSAIEIKKKLNPNTKLVLWTQHASNQPAVAGLKDKEVQDCFDKIVLISNWQIEDYARVFGISDAVLLRNAISPAFENMSGTKEAWSMTYTSTPFRGLSLLPDIFRRVKKNKPKAALSVFSSMKVYQADKDGENEYEQLYEACRKTDGIKYVGSLSQQDLANRMKKIAILAYPNTFAETSCIGVMEAMAAGCQIVTSDLGAMPETTAGFGKLVKIIGRKKEEYIRDFVEELLKPIDKEKIDQQVKYMNDNFTWKVRAKEWTSAFNML